MRVQRRHISFEIQKIPRSVSIVLVLSILLVFSSNLTGQSSFDVNIALPIDKESLIFSYDSELTLNQFNAQEVTSSEMSSIRSIPKTYDFNELGIFCKFDVHLDAGSKIPLRFRLGTVAEVDAIERKGPTRYNY